MAVLNYAGRSRLAEYILEHPIHMGVGIGAEDWGKTPEEPEYYATGLIKEVGRIAMHRHFFVNEDDDGEIRMPDGDSYKLYTRSATPTRQIYMDFFVDFGEPIDAKIRETGVFIDTVFKPGLSKNQTFFTPDQIEDPGKLLLLEHLTDKDSEYLTSRKQGTFSCVITI